MKLFLGAVGHNSLAAVAGIAVPGAANALQGLVTRVPYLGSHHTAQLIVGIVAGAVARDFLKTVVPAFAASSGTSDVCNATRASVTSASTATVVTSGSL